MDYFHMASGRWGKQELFGKESVSFLDKKNCEE